MCHLKNEKPDLRDYAPAVVDKAETCLIKYWDWEKEHKFSSHRIEEPIISETYQYGGTPDNVIVPITSKKQSTNSYELLDYKSGKAIYDEYWMQLAAYGVALEENGFPIAQYRIIRLGKDEKEGFEEQVRTNLSREFEIFFHCLHIYNLQHTKEK
jgi:hypothetical protein